MTHHISNDYVPADVVHSSEAVVARLDVRHAVMGLYRVSRYGLS